MQTPAMINLLIKDSDSLYRQGMEKFLTDLFFEEFCLQAIISSDFNRTNVSQADVIVMELCKGESFMCFPELQTRGRSLIIGVINHDFVKVAPLAGCISDITFVKRSASLESIRRNIIRYWERKDQPNALTHSNNCYICRHKRLSYQQVRIMSGIYSGKTYREISEDLNINQKVVYSHKYVVMNKFNLRSDYELLIFLNKLKEKNPVYNCLNDSPEY